MCIGTSVEMVPSVKQAARRQSALIAGDGHAPSLPSALPSGDERPLHRGLMSPENGHNDCDMI